MARYFMNIRDNTFVVPDFEGSELPDLSSAMHEAKASALEPVVSDIRAQSRIGEKRIEIVDENGAVLGTVMLRDMIP
jgi:hypothetical protein